MITLKIKGKGHLIEIPGIPTFRSPANVNIKHGNIPLIVSALQSQGIEKFEIVSDTQGNEKIFTEKDFKDSNDYKIGDRLSKLEGMIEKLLRKKDSNLPLNQEQITDKLEKLELLSNAILESAGQQKSYDGEPRIEDLDTFIPEIDIKGVQMRGDSVKEIFKKEDDDTDETADLLASLTGGNK